MKKMTQREAELKLASLYARARVKKITPKEARAIVNEVFSLANEALNLLPTKEVENVLSVLFGHPIDDNLMPRRSQEILLDWAKNIALHRRKTRFNKKTG